MKKQPVKVQLVGKNNDRYQIKFPYLETPVEVNEQLYSKMLYSDQYQFRNTTGTVNRTHPG
ncbi:hypothetical protein [Aquimarina rubra]|uniref:Uncharacterized protein n=1 Tax=Aquimarina rubra TaxID=1920033 RepID=A0ABW5LJI5_9FLAO